MTVPLFGGFHRRDSSTHKPRSTLVNSAALGRTYDKCRMTHEL